MRNLSSTRFSHRKYENDSSKLKFWQFDRWIQKWQKWVEESRKRNDHRLSLHSFFSQPPLFPRSCTHINFCKLFTYASLSESLGQAMLVLTISGTLSINFVCHATLLANGWLIIHVLLVLYCRWWTFVFNFKYLSGKF